MDYMTEAGIALAVGLIVGYLAGSLRGSRSRSSGGGSEGVDWWEMRKSLTVTQLQILQFMESKKEASINDLQEKFTFIPDRELYYRLEQIYLMGFLLRERKQGKVVYSLNSDYSGTVEGDKTVMLGQEGSKDKSG
ncbi:MAG: hypothetical protein HUJ31_13915 [Pseudomonadales bacterium]|nr:hypothetical protein [Pseudomonadales bacterium]